MPQLHIMNLLSLSSSSESCSEPVDNSRSRLPPSSISISSSLLLYLFGSDQPIQTRNLCLRDNFGGTEDPVDSVSDDCSSSPLLCSTSDTLPKDGTNCLPEILFAVDRCWYWDSSSDDTTFGGASWTFVLCFSMLLSLLFFFFPPASSNIFFFSSVRS